MLLVTIQIVVDRLYLRHVISYYTDSC
jgi:hypothetical protein